MKKIRSLNESDFLKLLFGFISAAFLVAAVLMPDREEMFSGLWSIMSQPGKVTTNYFWLGGYAGAFLNMGLVGLIFTVLFVALKGKANNVSTLGFLLTVGFAAWGINPMNLWPTVLGVVVYGLLRKENLGTLCNAMMFSTGIAPIISDLLVRYPNAEVVGFNLPGLGLAVAVGLFIGMTLPAGLAASPASHKGFDLYSAALPIGLTAFFLNAMLYKTMGIALPAAPAGDTLQVADGMIVNTFCCVLFGLCILSALLLGCTVKDYWKLLTDPAAPNNISGTYGNAVFLMNVGVYGLFILGYYNLIGASFNAVTFGCIFCMLACCNSGSHPGTVWPIMLGYVCASTVFGVYSRWVGGEYAMTINAQAIVIGLCFANGLSPITGKYGWSFGFLASAMHFVLVTSVPNLHGGFCLYNGGLTAAFICMLAVPQLEKFWTTKAERKALKTK